MVGWFVANKPERIMLRKSLALIQDIIQTFAWEEPEIHEEPSLN
jgi:hypothetical protein